jgi:hypothetical protein
MAHRHILFWTRVASHIYLCALVPRRPNLRPSSLIKPGGDLQFVTIVAAIAEDGIEAVSVACELALEAKASVMTMC